MKSMKNGESRSFSLLNCLNIGMGHLNESDLTSVRDFEEGKLNSKSYQDPELVVDFEEQFIKNKESRINRIDALESSTSELATRKRHLLLGFLLSIDQNSMNVADIGGGNGYMRDWVYGIFDKEKLNWDVYESEDIAAAYKKHEDGLNIRFRPLTEFSSSAKYDLTILSSVLQYLSNWCEILESAMENSRNVLIMRTPMTPAAKHAYYIQRNNTDVYAKSKSSWPLILFSKMEFETVILGKMKIALSYKDYEETFSFEGHTLPMTTYFLNKS